MIKLNNIISYNSSRVFKNMRGFSTSTILLANSDEEVPTKRFKQDSSDITSNCDMPDLFSCDGGD